MKRDWSKEIEERVVFIAQAGIRYPVVERIEVESMVKEVIHEADIAIHQEREKAVDVFRQFVENYCHEIGLKDIYESSEHYVEVFKNLINKEEVK